MALAVWSWAELTDWVALSGWTGLADQERLPGCGLSGRKGGLGLDWAALASLAGLDYFAERSYLPGLEYLG